ncbi:MAG: hypothetical protein ACE5FL_08880 [Myxococcota bacterium]
MNEIGAAVALEDFQRAERAAHDLVDRAVTISNFDISLLGIDPKRQSEFNAYANTQRQAGSTIAKAAKHEDAVLVIQGLESLLNSACIGCHASFRRNESRIRPSVLFMTTYLSAWQDINRGILTDDFELVARRAHEIQTIGRVFTWDQVIESLFGISDPKDRSEFREFLRRVTAQARQLERAADENQIHAAVTASRRMWTDGCLACHAQFRGGR